MFVTLLLLVKIVKAQVRHRYIALHKLQLVVRGYRTPPKLSPVKIQTLTQDSIIHSSMRSMTLLVSCSCNSNLAAGHGRLKAESCM